MRRLLLTICIVLVIRVANAQPSSDIYLFDLKMKKGNISLENGKNITNHPGYDNQPYFHPEIPLLYYASADSSGNTDIKVYDFASGKTSVMTRTKDREYSPTVTPDQQYISCIIQRENGAQDLGKYPLGGGPPVVIVNNLTVGYHVWQNSNTLFLFVLGQPITLRRYSAVTGKDTVLSENIGRSLHKIPNTSSVSYVQKTSSGDWLITKIDENGNSSILGSTRPNKEDLAWTMDGRIIMSDGNKLFVMTPGTKGSWKEVPINIGTPLKAISRIAINTTGGVIALVVEE